MPEIPRRKRIVLEHVTGRLAGMSQIQGTTEEAPDPLPDFCPGINRPFDADKIDASLVRVRRGAVYFREIIVPDGLGTFDRSQR